MNLNDIIQQINNKEERELNLFNAEFENILLRIEDEIAISAIESIGNPLEFDREVQRILNETGYYALINKFIDESYDKSYEEILSALKQAGISATFSTSDIATLEELKDLDIEFFKQIGNEASETLRRDLYKYQLSNMDKVTLTNNIRQSLLGSPLAKYSKTYAETALSNYHQAVFDLKIKGMENELVYVYTGASPDKIIRKFCKCVMKDNKYYSKSDGDSLKSDKRRKYNCRHNVIGITEKRAIELGYKKGTFTC